MPTSTLILTSLAAVATFGWIWYVHRREREIRGRLGDPVREFRIHNRWMLVAQTGLALLVIVAAIVAIVERGRSSSGYMGDLVRLLWIGGMLYAHRRSSILMVGPNGFALGGKPLVLWSDVEKIAWDRDIGQRRWGVAILVRRRERSERMRLYFNRSGKDEVEEFLLVAAGDEGHGVEIHEP